MDIRKWFTSPKGNTSSSSSQTVNKNSEKALKKEQKSSKKRRVIESDSDEDPIPKSPVKANKKSPKEKSKPSPEKKTVSISDFFGFAPVERSQKKEQPKPKKLKEEEIHEDADFEATLLQLDKEKTKEKKVNGHSKNSKGSDGKEPHSEVSAESSKVQNPQVEKNKIAKSAPGKKKSKPESTYKVEVTPAEKPVSKPKLVEEKKPVAKKPRGSLDYTSYLNREGPKALGSKEIPEGEENCLAGISFVVTGVLESMERDEAKVLIEKYGGKVMTTITKNTKYIVIGRDAGASKLDKAEKFGTIQLDEDGLLDLVRTLPGKSGTANPKAKASKTKSPASVPTKPQVTKNTPPKKVLDLEDEFEMGLDDAALIEEEIAVLDVDKKEPKVEQPKTVSLPSTSSIPKDSVKRLESPAASTSMWVDKYKPTSLKQVIGQQGDKSNAKKLLHWLLNFKKNRLQNKKPVPGRFNNPNDDGSGYKAALLSGPPGVGKTTTAILVCKEAGYDYFELNASDARSKKTLQQVISQLLGNQTLSNCFKADAGQVSSNHVIIMDEVDGMSGNEDRGGMAELISFIKASKVPIICICNDRNHTKIRSLSNHCFDLRFQKPRLEQIKAAMLSITFKEKLQISPEVLQDVIVASNQDIRQVLHNISMWSAKAKGLTSEQAKADIGFGVKHIKMGPFDVLREVFAIGNNQKATIRNKSNLFFHDYSIAPLFVQENYVHVTPTAAGGNKQKHLNLLSEAANSICYGDVIDRQIRNQNSWGLLPTQAIFASVVPGELMKGHLRQMISFPAWLGKNSNRNHMDRVLQELHVHMRMRVTGNKTDVALEYLPLLKRALTKPLIENETSGVPEALKIMEEYYLLREDFDSIIELSLWPQQTDPRTKIPTKVKSAFTRAYNKECGKNPYAVTNVKKKRGSAKDAGDDPLDEDASIESDEEEDSVEKDAMIKVKKPPTKKGTTEAGEPSTSGKEKKKNPPKKGRAK